MVELEADGRRLVLDAGLPLDLGPVPHRDLLPDVPGLWAHGDGSLCGLVVSHGHPDHYGLADLVTGSVPVLLGERAAAILDEAAFFVPSARRLRVTDHLRHREPVRLGPFTVTPWLVDHSAFDAYALLVGADGQRLLYTGDVRAHGRKGHTLTALAEGVGAIDVLLMEGTRVRSSATDERAPSEKSVEAACVGGFRSARGMALAFYSAQNIDRLVTLYRAAKRSGRTFVMDLYTAATAAATGNDKIPQSHWDGVRVYLPHSQRSRVIGANAFERTDGVKADRIYAGELRTRRAEIVMTCRGSMLGELERAEVLDGASAVWSMWPGYLDRPSGRRTRESLVRLEIPLAVRHASGHASREDLVGLARSIDAKRTVPIHTDAPDAFDAEFGTVVRHGDGEWWEVGT